MCSVPASSRHATDSSCAERSHGKANSIHSIQDSVLLEIFDLCREERLSAASHYENCPATLLEWQLVHVCQRWRYLILASASRLDLKLVCSPGTPVRKKLDSWPAFPIIIDYDKVASEDIDNIIAALEHPDRVCRIALSGLTGTLWEKLDAAMQEPFPALTHLSLTGPKDIGELVPVLLRNLLGGGALRLQELYLQRVSCQWLPQLLLSARDLISLRFTKIPSTSYFSPEEMLTGLAGLSRLKSLEIRFQNSTLLNLLTDERLETLATPAISRAVHLPALKTLLFEGFCEYLEGLVSHIDAPQVTSFSIDYFGQPVYRVPQLAQFLIRSKYHKALSHLQIRCVPWVHLWFSVHGGGSLMFQMKTSGMVRGILHSVQVLQQISASISNTHGLDLVGPAPASTEPPFGGSLYGSTRFAKTLLPQGSLFTMGVYGVTPREEQSGVPDSIDHIDWIGLFRLFTGAEELVIRGAELSESVVHALEKVSGDAVTKVLPALRSLIFARERPTVSVAQFVSVRQKAGRPVTVVYPDDEYDQEEEEDDDDDTEEANDEV